MVISTALTEYNSKKRSGYNEKDITYHSRNCTSSRQMHTCDDA